MKKTFAFIILALFVISLNFVSSLNYDNDALNTNQIGQQNPNQNQQNQGNIGNQGFGMMYSPYLNLNQNHNSNYMYHYSNECPFRHYASMTYVDSILNCQTCNIY